MDVNFDYNFRGIIPVPARALKGKKIVIGAIFVLLAMLIFSSFAYLALIIDGFDISAIYSQYGLAPFAEFDFESSVAVALYSYIGPILAVFAIMVGILAISAIDFEDLRGNPFLSYRKAIKFGFGRARQLFLAELAILLFLALIVGLGIIVGLITRVPYVGELLYSVFFFFPNFIITLFSALIIFIQVLSILLMPAAAASSRKGETFHTILETFLTITRQPMRWVAYTVYSVVAAKLASFLFAYVAYWGVQLLYLITFLGGGEKINILMASGLKHLSWQGGLVKFITNIFPGINFGFEISLPNQGGTDSIAGYIMAVSLSLVFLMVWGYILSVIATGQAYAFAILKKMRDDYIIADEEPLYFKAEWVNLPIKENQGKPGHRDNSKGS